MSNIHNVIVLGATGNVGREVVKALLNASFQVTVGCRPNSGKQHIWPDGVAEVEIDYTSLPGLKQAFTNQDVIVEAFNPSVAAHQEQILHAAIVAGVRHVITPDFSSDTFNPNVEDLMIFEPKLKAQAILEKIANTHGIHWTAIIAGPFFDWAIPRGIFWVNPKSKEVIIFGSGNQRVSMSAIDIVGRATVAILKNPNAFVNRPAYFADFTVTSNELLAMLNDIDGSASWKPNNIPLSGFFEQARKNWEQDTINGVQDRLNSSAYQMLGTYGIFEESNRYGADFSDRVEEGFGVSKDEFKEMLSKAIA